MGTTVDKARKLLPNVTWGTNRMAFGLARMNDAVAKLYARPVTYDIRWSLVRLRPDLDTSSMSCGQLAGCLRPLEAGAGGLTLAHVRPVLPPGAAPGLNWSLALQAAATARGHVKDTVRWLSELEDAFAGSADEMPSAGRALMQFWAVYWTGRPPFSLTKAFPRLLGDAPEHEQLKRLRADLWEFSGMEAAVSKRFGVEDLDAFPSDKFGSWFSLSVAELLGEQQQTRRLCEEVSYAEASCMAALDGVTIDDGLPEEAKPEADPQAVGSQDERPAGQRHWSWFATAAMVGTMIGSPGMSPEDIASRAEAVADILSKGAKARGL
jgi:hypothetical protein